MRKTLLAGLILLFGVLGSNRESFAQRANAEFVAEVNPVKIQERQLNDGVTTIVYREPYLYVINVWSGLQIIDVTNPVKPVSVSALYLPAGQPKSLDLKGDIAYITNDVGDIMLVDISDPKNPKLTMKPVTIGEENWEIKLNDKYAYIAGGSKGLLIVDISDTTNIHVVGSAAAAGGYAWGLDVHVNEKRAYISDKELGLLIYDISDPTKPKLLGSYKTPGAARRVAVEENVAYIADGPAGVFILDLSEVQYPRLIKNIPLQGYANGLIKVGDFLYVGNEESGLRIIGVKNPRNPMLAFTYDTKGKTYDVVRVGGKIYVADNTSTQILRQNLAPVVEPIEPQIVTENTPLQFTVKMSDPDDDPIARSARHLPKGATFDVNNGDFSWTPTYEQSGKYQIVFYVVEKTKTAFDDSQTVEITVHHVNRPPVMADLPDRSLEENRWVSFAVGASDPDKEDRGKLSYTIEGDLPSGAQFLADNRLFVWVPNYEQSGEYNVTFVVTDAGYDESLPGNLNKLSAKKTIKITVKDVNRPPQLSQVGIKSVNENQELSIQLEAADPDKADEGKLVFTLENPSAAAPAPTAAGRAAPAPSLPAGVKLDKATGLFTWTPNYDQAGLYTFLFSITDPHGATTKDYATVNVINVNRPPKLAEIGPKSVDENKELKFNLVGSDEDPADKTRLSYSYSLLPQGAKFDSKTGAFSWIPTYDQSGEYPIAFTVRDGEGVTDSKQTTITVRNMNRPPVLSAIEPKVINEADEIRFAVMATDPDREDMGNLQFSVGNLPEGASFNQTTHEFSWKPTYDQSGKYTIPFTATDGSGAKDSKTAQITVNNVDRQPTFAKFPDQKGKENGLIKFAIPFVDPDKEDKGKVQVFATAGTLPPGAKVDPLTTSFLWTPTYEQAGHYSIEFNAKDPQGKEAKKTITVVVDETNRPPTMNAILPQKGEEKKELTFTVSGTDPDKEDADKLVYSAEGLPNGSSLDPKTGVFKWIPEYDQAGTYNVTFTVTDAAGATSSKSTTITIANVSRLPVMAAIEPKTVKEDVDLVFNVIATDPDIEDQGKLKFSATGLPAGATFDVNSRSYRWAPSFEQSGNYTVKFTVTDPSGLSDSKDVSISVVNVNRPPRMSEVGGRVVDENKEVSFTISATDLDKEDEGKLGYTVQGLPQGAKFDVATKAFSWTPTYDQSGLYNLIFIVTDASKASDSSKVQIAVNNINRPPELTKIGKKGVKEAEALTFKVTATDPDKEDQGRLLFSVRDLPPGSSYDATAGTFSWTPQYDQAGEYKPVFVVTDAFGASASEEVDITVENVNRPPAMASVEPKTVNENENLSFTVSATDPDKEDQGKLVFSATNLPAGATFDSGTRTFAWIPSHEQAGEYKVVFSVKDLTGQSSTAEGSVSIKNVNRLPILGIIGDRSVNENEELKFNISGKDPDQEDEKKIVFAASGLPEGASFDAASQIFTWRPTFEQSGSYKVTFTLTDPAGAKDESKITINVNNINRNPSMAEIGLKEIDENTKLSFTVSGSDLDKEDQGKLTYSATNLPAGATFDEKSATFNWTPTYEQAGSYQVAFTIKDSYNASDSKEATIRVKNVNRSPRMEKIAEKIADENKEMSFAVSANDPDKEDEGKLLFSAFNLPNGARFEGPTRTFVWKPTYEQSGKYTVVFMVKDAMGASDSTRAALVVNNVNRTPELAFISDKTVNENEDLTIKISATDPDKEDQDKLTFATEGQLPAGAKFDAAGQTLSWKPTFEQAGDYTVKFRVSDAVKATDDQSVVINVKNVNRPPVLTAIGSKEIKENSALTFLLKATDPDKEDAGNITFSASGLPTGATLDNKTGNFSWTPTYDQSGDYTVKFFTHDGAGGSVSEDVAIKVNNVSRPPALATPDPQTINEDQLFTYLVSGTDPDNEDEGKLSYSASSLPKGASFDSSSHVLKWKPEFDQSGNYSVKFTVTDPTRLSDSKDLKITVTNVNRPPAIDPIAEKTVDENKPVSFTVSANDPDQEDKAKLTISAEGVPTGARFDALTKTFSWTPNYDQSGIYLVKFTVKDGGGATDITAANIHVINVNRQPKLTAIGSKTTAEQKELAFTISAKDPDKEDDGKLIFGAKGLPAGSKFDAVKGTFSWTPDYNSAGDTKVKFIVHDTEGSEDSESVNIKVTFVNRPPKMSALENHDTDEGKSLTFVVSAVDPDEADAGKLKFSASGVSTGPQAAGLPTGAKFDATSRTFNWTPTYEQTGSYNVRFTVTDGSNASDSKEMKISVANVNRAPAMNPVNNQNVDENKELKFNINGTDPDTGDKLTFSASGLPNGALFDAATKAFSWTPTHEQSGVYRIKFTISDGGLSDSRDVEIVVRNVNRPPVIKEVTAKETAENKELAFDLNSSDPDKEDLGKLKYFAKNLPNGASFDNAKGSFKWTPSYEQSGEYKVTFGVTDSYGATDQKDVTIKVTNVNRPPVLSEISDKNVNENEEVSFTLQGTDPDREDLNSLSYTAENVPTGATFDASSHSFRWRPNAEQGGTYRVKFVVKDAGGMSDTKGATIIVKNVNRPPKFGSLELKEVNENEDLVFIVPGSDPDVEDMGKLKYSSENLPQGATLNASTGECKWKPTFDQAGTYQVKFTITDPGGGSDAGIVFIIVKNVNRPPVFTELKNVTGEENKEITFTLSATDPDKEDAGKIVYTANKTPGGELNPTTGVFRWTPKFGESGDHAAEFVATDLAGASTKMSVSISVKHVSRPPIISEVAPIKINENTDMSFAVLVDDPDPDDLAKLTVTAEGLPPGATFDAASHVVNWHPSYEQSGDYKIKFTLKDPTGLTDTKEATITVANINRPPLLADIGDKDVDENKEFVLPLNGKDEDKEDTGKIVFAVEGKLPTGAVLNAQTGELKWTPSYEQSGTFDLTFKVTDGSGASDSRSSKITVRNVNRPPVLAEIIDKTVDENTKLTFTLAGTDPDKEDTGKLSYSAQGMPTGATLDAKGVFTWTPSFEQSGAYKVTFNVNDVAGATDLKVVNITVKNVNRPPVLSKLTDKTADQNKELSILLEAKDPDVEDAGKLKFSATGLPAGATVDPALGAFKWIPTYDQGGKFVIDFTVTDEGGLKATEKANITVTKTNRPPAFPKVEQSSYRVDEGQPVNINWPTAVDPDKDDQAKLTYKAELLPRGAVFDPVGKSIKWTPGYDVVKRGSQRVEIKIVAKDPAGGEAELTYTIVVKDENRPPVADKIPEKIVVAGQEVSFQLKVNDPDGDQVNLLALNLPAGAQISPTGLFRWRPTAKQAGEYNFTITATDGSANTDIPIKIKVTK